MSETGRRVESLERDFEEFGLNGYEARVLVALVRLGTATANDIATLTVLNRTSVYPVLQDLTSRGLADEVPGRTAQWASLPPGELLERLYEIHESRLVELHQRKQQTRRTLAHLVGKGAGPLPYVHFLRGLAQGQRAYDQILAVAAHEVLVWNVPPYSSAVGKPNDAVLAALRRGVRFRALYQAAEMVADDAEAFRRENDAYHAAGVEGRVAGALPAKLVVVDRQVALLALPDPRPSGDGFPTTLHIEHAGFASMQADSFEVYWKASRAYPGGTARSRG